MQTLANRPTELLFPPNRLGSRRPQTTAQANAAEQRQEKRVQNSAKRGTMREGLRLSLLRSLCAWAS